MFLLYNLVITALSPIWVPWMLFRAWRRKEQPNWDERTGRFKDVPAKSDKPRIWFHAVSVGEFLAAQPILRAIRAALPGHEIVLSVTTSSGHKTARENGEKLFDYLVYFPIDIPRFQLMAMQKVRPDAVVIMETELWMNFLWAAKVFDAGTILVNGRISDRSFPRSMKIRAFYRALLRDLDLALMQSELDAERISALGAKEPQVLGNSKFDQAAEVVTGDPAYWRRELGIDPSKKVVVVGSTRGVSEETQVVAAISVVGLDRVQVIHGPRHIETADGLEGQVRTAFGGAARRSRGETGPYLILDTYGELAQIYGIADVVIVGGGFVNLGGQNIFQPLAQGKPVLHGPHMQNFRDITAMADRAGAAVCCSGPGELGQGLAALLGDEERRRRMGEAARGLVRENVGASERYGAAVAGAVRALRIAPKRGAGSGKRE